MMGIYLTLLSKTILTSFKLPQPVYYKCNNLMSCIDRPSNTPVMSVFQEDQILTLPDLPLWAQLPYTLLPLPNVIDQWLLTNNIDTAHSNNIPNRPYSRMGDLL